VLLTNDNQDNSDYDNISTETPSDQEGSGIEDRSARHGTWVQ
jgi:hypothetical protein